MKLTIVKVGGKILSDSVLLQAFLKAFVSVEGKKILVHGGGKLANENLTKRGKPVIMVDGRRVTDEETLEVVVMTYAGLVNKQLVSNLQAHNVNAVGLCGADGNIILSQKRAAGKIDYGFVGDPISVNCTLLKLLCQNDFTPCLSAITHDADGQLLNTNADTIAKVVAVAMSEHYEVSLRYCFEFLGVLADRNNPDSIEHQLNESQINNLINIGVISGGMIPKVANALEAKQAGIMEVVICGIPNLLEPKKSTRFLVS